MAAAVISGRPGQPGFREYILKFKDNPAIKGIRQVLHVSETPQGYCLQPDFVHDIQFLGERGQSFDLCMRSGELLDADKLVAQCPHTRFIVDHCGNMSVQTEAAHAGLGWKGCATWRITIMWSAKCRASSPRPRRTGRSPNCAQHPVHARYVR